MYPSFRILRLAIIIILLVCSKALSATSPKSSPFRSGHWVKIRVPDSGIYQLTKSQLMEMGFETPDKVAVFGCGGVPLTDDDASAFGSHNLRRQTAMRFGDKLIFYGEGPLSVRLPDVNGENPEIVRNPYSLYGYYFLTETDDESDSPAEEFDRSRTNPVTRHRHVEIFDEERCCYENMGTRWFELPFQSAPVKKYKLDKVHSDLDVEAAISVAWLTDVAGTFMADLSEGTILNSEGLSAESVKKASLRTARLECTLPHGQAPALTVGFSNTRNKGFTAIDYIVVEYDADNVLADRPQVELNFQRLGADDYVEVVGAPEIWDVTVPAEVVRLSVSGGKVTPSNAVRNCKLIAFDPSRDLLTPEIVGPVEHQNLSEKSTDVDMLIVAHPEFLDAARDLAQIHHDLQGIDVLTVSDEQIYNEFSSGQPSAMAIRAYARSVYAQSGGRLKYLLLYGAGSYDNREILVHGAFLPTYQCTVARYMFDSEKSYCSDSYFGMMDEKVNPDRMIYGRVSLGVGRLTVSTGDEAFAVNEKIRWHIENGPSVSNVAGIGIFLADSGDGGLHLKNADMLASVFSEDSVNVARKVYSDLAKWKGDKGLISKDEYKAYLQMGCGYVHYVGHGTEYNISGQDLWSVSDVASTEYSVRPIVFHSSCLNGRFDGDRRSLAEEMLAVPSGGAVGCIMASRNTDATYNQRLHSAFIKRVQNAESGTTLGDVWLMSQNECVEAASDVNNSAYAINVRHFNLIGDPVLPLYVPDYKAVTTAVNGASLGDSGERILTGPEVVVKGEVRDNSGSIFSGFNGTIEVRAYRTDLSLPTLRQDGQAEKVWVKIEDVLVGKVCGAVVDGEFAVCVKLPVGSDGYSYKLVYLANGETLSAKGALDGLSVEGGDGWVSDLCAPEITSLIVVGEHASGMVISPTEVYADMFDGESGVCVSEFGPGSGCRLRLDGVRVPIEKTMLDMSDDGSCRLTYPLPLLADGRHELTLTAMDNAGNKAEKSLTFTVLNRSASVELSPDSRAVRDSVEFEWSCSLGESSKAILLIRDMNGQTVYNREFEAGENFYKWDLRKTDGSYVDDGPYDCSMLASDGRGYAYSPKVRIIVLN